MFRKLLLLSVMMLSSILTMQADEVTYSPVLDVNFRTAAGNTAWQTVKNAADEGNTSFELTYTAGFFALQKYTVANLQTATKLVITLTVGAKSGVDAVKVWPFALNDWDATTSAATIVDAVTSVVGVAPRATEGTVNTPPISGKKVTGSSPAQATFTIEGDALTAIKQNATSDGTFTLLFTDDKITTQSQRSYLSSNTANAEASRPVLVATVDASVTPDDPETPDTPATASTTLTPTVDTYLRLGNTANHGAETTIELCTSAADNKDFVGYLSFNYAVPEDMELESAKLRLTTERIKGDRGLNIFAFDANVAGDAKYADYADAITAAKAGTAVATVSLEGQSGKSVASDDITTAKYQTIAGWQNTVDITDHVKAQTGQFGLLLARSADANNSNKIFTSEATGIENTKCDYFQNVTASDLTPQLILTFKALPGATKYDIAIAETENGTVEADKQTAKAGAEVTLTVMPEAGYKAKSVTVEVTTAAGAKAEAPAVGEFVEVTKVNNTTYTFTMPENNVLVSAVFAENTTEPNITYDKPTRTITLTNTKAAKGGTMHYTLNGGAEQTTMEATVELVISENTAVKAWIGEGDDKSEDVELTCNVAAKPTIAYTDGSNKVTLTLTAATDTNTADATIYYTTDGTEPTVESTAITATTAIDVTEDMTIVKAFAIDANGNYSEAVEQAVEYTYVLTVAKEWTTYLPEQTIAVPEGMKAYTVSSVTKPENGAAGQLEVTEQTVMEAGVPMLLQAQAGTFRTKAATGTVTGATAPEYKGAMEAKDMSDGGVYYILTDGVFLRCIEGTLAAGNCYLDLTGSEAAGARSFVIVADGKVITGLNGLTVSTPSETNAKVYDLSGRQWTNGQLPKGVYIQNGKKMIMK